MFPLNPTTDTHLIRHREKYKVNKCHSEYYLKSAIPFLQRKLNTYSDSLKDGRREEVLQDRGKELLQDRR